MHLRVELTERGVIDEVRVVLDTFN